MTPRGYPKHVRDKAAELREAGVSRARIARELGIGLSTVARWFREDGATRPEGASRAELSRFAHRRTVEERWAHQQAEQNRHRDAIGELTERELFLVGVALYWAEGAKSKPWRKYERLTFVNSDENVICVFLAWLDLLGVAREALRCRLLIHETADLAAAEEFWRETVGR